MDDQRRKHRDDLIKTLEEEIEIAKGQWKSEMSDEQREKLSLRIHQKLDQISVLKVNANKNRQEQKGIPTPAQNLTFQNSDIEEEKVGSVNAKKQSFIRATNIKLSINNLLKIVFVMIVTVVGITYFWQSSKFKSSELLPTPTPSINSSSDSQSLTPISNPTPTSTSSSPTTNPSSGIPTTISSPKTPSSKTYIDFFNEGLNKESNGDIDRAIADYTESIRLNPNYARAYNNLAWAKYLQGNSQEGLVYVDKSLSLDSTKANSHHTRGAILLELNRSQEAIESFNIAINLNNQFALVYQDRRYQCAATKRKLVVLADIYGLFHEYHPEQKKDHDS
jgi:tetratricopeptide (TPR) repeat protein